MTSYESISGSALFKDPHTKVPFSEENTVPFFISEENTTIRVWYYWVELDLPV